VIDAEKANYKIAWMCRLLGVPRSSFYAWRSRAETATAARRRELAAQVRRVFDAGRGAYGCRRVAAQLNRDGHPCSVGLVADLMRELGLRASAEFARFCQAHGIRTSTGRTGVCWDNAAAGSFFGALKNEMYYRQSFPDRARARFAVANYIEVFYNRQRLHSALGYRPPFEVLTEFQAAATAA
jgi:transposase InsO family protein